MKSWQSDSYILCFPTKENAYIHTQLQIGFDRTVEDTEIKMSESYKTLKRGYSRLEQEN